MKFYRRLIISLLIGLSGSPAGASLATVPDAAICANAVRNGQWETTKEKIIYVEEARARKLSCGIKAKVSVVEYSNGYLQASLRCGEALNGERGWSATLDGYANPHGFVLYQNYISGEGEIGYTFLQARKSKTFGNANGWHVTGRGRRESGQPWSFRFDMPPGGDLLAALKAGVKGFENPDSQKNRRECTLKAYNFYRPVNPEMVNSLRENITELRAKAQNEEQKAQALEAKNKSIATELSARTAELVKMNTLVDTQESKFNEQKQIHEALIKKNENLLAQLNQARQAAEKIKAGTKKEKDLEAKLAKMNSLQKEVAGNLAKAQKELGKTQKEKESLAKSIEDLKKAHQQEIASLKKLIPVATLENQKLTKIASDASGKNSKPISSASDPITKTKIQIKFEARLLAKAKEFGDGFTNYEASLNKVLLAVEIRDMNLEASSKKNPNRFDYVVIDEGKPAIPESNEVRESVLAQGVQGSGTNTLVRAFEIPMSIDTGSLKVVALDGSTIVGETKLKTK